MSKKNRKSARGVNSRRKRRGEEYAPSCPLVSAEDIKAIKKKPLTEEYTNRNISTTGRITIVNGVVITSGRYSRLFEDYDDN